MDKQEQLAKELRELGLATAASTIKVRSNKRDRMVKAYENYKYVTQEHLTRYNKELRRKTEKCRGKDIVFQEAALIGIEGYPEIPPKDVLEALKTAKATQIFDSFQILRVEQRTERAPEARKKDPILFGRVDGCGDFFFIAQWGNDVKFEDLVTS